MKDNFKPTECQSRGLSPLLVDIYAFFVQTIRNELTIVRMYLSVSKFQLRNYLLNFYKSRHWNSILSFVK